jgi:hypothetical protein
MMYVSLLQQNLKEMAHSKESAKKKETGQKSFKDLRHVHVVVAPAIIRIQESVLP